MISYWEQQSFFAPQDVIIIGGGYMGLWSAIALKMKKPNAKITILEKGLLPTGASTKNAGFACFGSPTELIKEAQEYGEDAMWNLVAKRYHGLRKIHNTFSYTQIDYSNSGGYECLLQKDVALVQDKLDWLNKGMKDITGVEQVFKFCKEKLSTFGLSNLDSLVENYLEGSLHPAKLVQQLQQKATSLGIQIRNGIQVTQLEKQPTIKLTTDQNMQFTCNQLLICTNGFAKQLLPALDVMPKRAQVFITQPIENLALKGCFHFDEGFYYFRNVGNRLLIGGARNQDMENENTDSLNTTDTIQKALQAFTNKHILANQVFTIANQWSGTMGFGSIKQPIVQQVEENIYCAVRMSGMGVALAPMLAEDVVSLLQY
jgi:gamma-glutamylputrescine oxidase